MNSSTKHCRSDPLGRGWAFGGLFPGHGRILAPLIEPTMHSSRKRPASGRISKHSTISRRLRRSARLSGERLEKRDLLSVTPVGDPFQVNPISEGDQNTPLVAANADGDFLVVWNTAGRVGESGTATAQRFESDGTRVGDPIPLPFFPGDIALENSGGFVIVSATVVQRFDEHGAMEGEPVEFNPMPPPNTRASSTSVAIDAEGDLVIAWRDVVLSAYQSNIVAQRIGADGGLQGGRFQVNTTEDTEGEHVNPTVAMDAEGDFVIAWNRDFGQYGIFAQRYNAAGEAQGEEIRVTPAESEEKFANADVAIDQDGDFVVAWNRYFASILSAVFTRRYSAAGEPLEDAVQVDTVNPNSALRTLQDIALDADGDYVVTWTHGQGPSSFIGGQLFFQRFTSDGARDGGETPVDDSTEVSRFLGGLAMAPEGDFVVVWADEAQDSDGDDVFARRFEVAGVEPTIATDTVGVYSITSSSFFLRNSNSAGDGDLSFPFGAADQGYIPLAGDWDGDGTDTIGVYSEATGAFFLRNSSSAGPGEIAFHFGAGGQGYIAVVGDWDGDGTDSIGLYSPVNGAFLLKNSNSAGAGDIVVFFGAGGEGLDPLAGDWDGDGADTVGLYRSEGGVFFLRNVNEPGAADVTVQYGPGGAGLSPVVGSWDGDADDTVGLYRTADATFLLRNENTAGPADVAPFAYGAGGETLLPRIGNWDGVDPISQNVVLAGADPDQVIPRLTQLGIDLQSFLSRHSIDLRYVDLPGDELIDVSGRTASVDGGIERAAGWNR